MTPTSHQGPRGRTATRGLSRIWALAGGIACGILLGGPATVGAQLSTLAFEEVGERVGAAVVHAYDGPLTETRSISGGVAAGDLDDDGWTDLVVVRGTAGPPVVLLNRGDGTFGTLARGTGLDDLGPGVIAPSLADLDGDGTLDLVFGGIEGETPRVYQGLGDGTFDDVTPSTGIFSQRDTFSSAAGDFDRDGDLDLFLAHWSRLGGGAPHLWRNDGGFHFSPVDFRVGIAPIYLTIDFTFTPNFADLDGDGWPELLVAGDFGTSRIFKNSRDGRFEIDPRQLQSDENGMGAAVGDFDNDGHLDWFVSSIWDPDGVAEGDWGVTGNRLYRNRGDGVLEEATDAAGVRQGYWGWGSCAADFDNDGWLDLFQTNGFLGAQATDFADDPARLWINRGDGTFEERSFDLGVDERGQGRGVVCFDADRDGDVDLFVQLHSEPSRLFRNNLRRASEGGPHFLTVQLADDGANRHAVGGRVTVETQGRRQLRELRAGSNFQSQNPNEAHFGLADASRVDRLTVRWPDGRVETLTDVAADQLLQLGLEDPGTDAVAIPTTGALPQGLLALTLLALALRRLA